MGRGSVAARSFETLLRVLELCSAIIILGITSYFLAILNSNHLIQPNWIKGVEGISGAATIYTIFGVCLTLCLGGIPVLGYIAVFLDICFFGCYIAVAYLYRGGAGSCDGFVRTPLGDGDIDTQLVITSGDGNAYTPNLRQACKLETAAFAIALINLIFFLFSAIFQIVIVRMHVRDKKAGKKVMAAPAGRQWWKKDQTTVTAAPGIAAPSKV